MIMASGNARADSTDPHTFSTEVPPLKEFVPSENTPHIGTIVIENSVGQMNEESQAIGFFNETIVVNIPNVGDVTFNVKRTLNSLCMVSCPDEWEVVDVPNGYIIIPSNIDIPENDFGRFLVYPNTVS
jgi:hypothetical protein